MRDRACVVKCEQNTVWVIPLLSDTCINCNQSSCAKRGSPFLAANPENLKLKIGDIVKIGVSKKAQFVQALIALFLPILAAICGYFLAESFAIWQGKIVTEGMRAAGVLLCFGLTTTLITILSRSKINLAKPIIVSVLSNSDEINNNPGQGC